MEATWYGRPFHGRATAWRPGLRAWRFDAWGPSVACNEFPLGTWLGLRNRETSRWTAGLVADRMPTGTPRGRMDLSEGVALQLGLKERGRARITVEVLRAR